MTATKPRRVSRGTRDAATKYAEQVLAGRVVTGKLVKLACQRHLKDLKAGRFVWDLAALEHVVNYFRDVLRLNGGDHEGKPFVLQPWQVFIVGSLFAWKRKDGTRRFRTAYLEIGKGNGKSPLAAGVGMYMLTADGEARAEVYAAAAKQDQAMILFRDAVAMVDQSPALAKRILKSGVEPVWNLAYHESGSFFRPIASDKAQSGPRPHCALLDEIHEHENDVVVSLMRAGTKGRRQALLLEITNSGWDQNSICWQHHDYSERVLRGTKQDDEWFAYVCGLDLEGGDDWRDEKVWPKANPNLGVSVPLEYVRRQVREAEGMPAQQSLVKRLNFCIWTQQSDPWLEMEVWDKNAGAVTPTPGQLCFAGLDLSSTTDTSALALIFPRPDGLDVVMRFWIPRDNLRKAIERDKVPYDQWEREGLVTSTAGNVIDYNFIRSEIQTLATQYQIKELAFDPYNARQLATDLMGDGLTMVEIRQGYLSLSPPMKELEKRLLEGTVRHGGNPVLRTQVGNVAVMLDPAGNKKMAKNKSTGRIDGPAALVNAMARVIVHPPEQSTSWLLTTIPRGN